MFTTILIIALVVGLVGLHRRGSPRAPSISRGGTWLQPARGMGVALLAVTTAASLFLTIGTASAYDVTTVDLGTASVFSVLGATTVTNAGDSVLNGSVGVSPGPDVTGFPPGLAASIEENTQPAIDAQAALTAAYLDAAGRTINETTASGDLTGLTLVGGVYAGPAKAALSLPGTLTLDGQGNPNSVFIFQTDSTLITGPGSTVSLINGAQACNVFWQVGSSATLDTGSTFVGNILALTSIDIADSVTVNGRALARNGEVTLINDTFTSVGCDLTPVTTTTAAAAAAVTTTTVAATTTTLADAAAVTTTTAEAGQTTAVTTPTGTPTSLPFTGQNSIEILVVAMIAFVLGAAFLRIGHGVGTKQD